RARHVPPRHRGVSRPLRHRDRAGAHAVHRGLPDHRARHRDGGAVRGRRAARAVLARPPRPPRAAYPPDRPASGCGAVVRRLVPDHAGGRLAVYVAVKGGERAIENAHRLLARERRGDPSVPELSLAQIEQQLALAVDRAMTEGSLYDRELAALAGKRAPGDLIEAVFLLRAYRTTLPRLGTSLPLETDRMLIRRRVSAIFKDVPGGQILGPTFDYTHRLLDFELAGGQDVTAAPEPHGI